MLIDDSTPEGICGSPLNKSRAKMMYSFPKSDRFRNIVRSPSSQLCPFYDIAEHFYRSTRAAGFGKGNKFDFTKGAEKTPGPCGYKLTRQLSEKKSFSFGLGRDKVSLHGIVPSRINKGDAPGPGQYPIRSSKSQIGYSFRIRYKEPTRDGDCPAPGKYDIPSTIQKEGIYANSKYINSRAPRLSHTDAGNRFKSFDTTLTFPAPWHYDRVDEINLTGHYNSSKYKNSLCRSFSKANRNTLGIDITKKNPLPGPGQYKLPSEFGHYKSNRDEGQGLKGSQSVKNL